MSKNNSWRRGIRRFLGLERTYDGRRKNRSLRIEPLEERQMLTIASLTALDNLAAEGNSANYGTYQIGVDEPSVNPITLNFRMSGSATYNSNQSSSDFLLYDSSGNQLTLVSTFDYGEDEYFWTGTITLPANESSLTIELRAVDDSWAESTETATMTLLAGSGYTVNTALSVANISLQDNDTWTVGVVATDSSAAEGVTPDTALFTLTRSNADALANTTTVTFGIDGTVSTSDFTLKRSDGTTINSSGGYYNNDDDWIPLYSITFASGETTATVELVPTNDSARESTETAIFTLRPGTGYYIDADHATASASLLDNDTWSIGVIATDSTAAEGVVPETGRYTFSRSG